MLELVRDHRINQGTRFVSTTFQQLTKFLSFSCLWTSDERIGGRSTVERAGPFDNIFFFSLYVRSLDEATFVQLL